MTEANTFAIRRPLLDPAVPKLKAFYSDLMLATYNTDIPLTRKYVRFSVAEHAGLSIVGGSMIEKVAERAAPASELHCLSQDELQTRLLGSLAVLPAFKEDVTLTCKLHKRSSARNAQSYLHTAFNSGSSLADERAAGHKALYELANLPFPPEEENNPQPCLSWMTRMGIMENPLRKAILTVANDHFPSNTEFSFGPIALVRYADLGPAYYDLG